jgi:hypothetical protein
VPFFEKMPQHADFPAAVEVVVSALLAIESCPPRPRSLSMKLRVRLVGELTD